MHSIIKACIFCGVVAIFIEENFSMPADKRLLLFDCDVKITCPPTGGPPEVNESNITEVCGSDGKTYQDKCHLDMQNQKNYCEVGNFNPITLVHEGNCTQTELSTFT